jgi:hypothetical protein
MAHFMAHVAHAMSSFPEGFCIEHDGQTYRPVRLRSYIAAAGNPVQTIDWATECPSCGTTFEIFTKLHFREPTRRCQACKAPGRPVRLDRSAA